MIVYEIYLIRKEALGIDSIKTLHNKNIHLYDDAYFDNLTTEMDNHLVHLKFETIEDKLWPVLFSFFSRPSVARKITSISWPYGTWSHPNLYQLVYLSVLNNDIIYYFKSSNITFADYDHKDDIFLQSIATNALKARHIEMSMNPQPKMFLYFYLFIRSMTTNNTIESFHIDNNGFQKWTDFDNLNQIYLLIIKLMGLFNDNIENVSIEINFDIHRRDYNPYKFIIYVNVINAYTARNIKNKQHKKENFLSLVSKHLTF